MFCKKTKLIIRFCYKNYILNSIENIVLQNLMDNEKMIGKNRAREENNNELRTLVLCLVLDGRLHYS